MKVFVTFDFVDRVFVERQRAFSIRAIGTQPEVRFFNRCFRRGGKDRFRWRCCRRDFLRQRGRDHDHLFDYRFDDRLRRATSPHQETNRQCDDNEDGGGDAFTFPVARNLDSGNGYGTVFQERWFDWRDFIFFVEVTSGLVFQSFPF